MEYLSSLVDLATRIVRKKIADLPRARGEWDLIRALLTRMVEGVDGAEARELLARHGVHCVAKRSERDRFWFTVPGCSKPVHVVARPKVAPPPPEELVIQDELDVVDLAGAVDGTGLKLFMFCDQDREGLGLATVTLALVANPQARWIVEGVTIVEEVLVFKARTSTVGATPSMSDEDEGIFRSAMTRRDVTVEDIDLELLEEGGARQPAAALEAEGESGA